MDPVKSHNFSWLDYHVTKLKSERHSSLNYKLWNMKYIQKHYNHVRKPLLEVGRQKQTQLNSQAPHCLLGLLIGEIAKRGGLYNAAALLATPMGLPDTKEGNF